MGWGSPLGAPPPGTRLPSVGRKVKDSYEARDLGSVACSLLSARVGAWMLWSVFCRPLDPFGSQIRQEGQYGSVLPDFTGKLVRMQGAERQSAPAKGV